MKYQTSYEEPSVSHVERITFSVPGESGLKLVTSAAAKQADCSVIQKFCITCRSQLIFFCNHKGDYFVSCDVLLRMLGHCT